MTGSGIKPALNAAAPAALPALVALDLRWGLAMALGMMGGWLARTGQSLEERKTWADIRRDLGVSVLISGGCIIATLYFARLTAADELGVAAIGFAVCWGGTDSLRLLRRFVLAPILAAIRRGEDGIPTTIEGARRQGEQLSRSASYLEENDLLDDAIARTGKAKEEPSQ